MNPVPSQKSLDLTRKISETINGQTFHHHFHVLYDIAMLYEPNQKLEYLEIGCFAGASACLMVQRPNTSITSIDLGWPISPSIAQANISVFNSSHNAVRYLQGNSNDPSIVSQANDRQYDIIFVDGDHSYHGVWQDFMSYQNMLKPGGYIVFDDYNDHEHSPEVRSAVDHIVNQLRQDFEIIGTLPNHLKARPDTLNQSNCFILHHIGTKPGPDIAVAMATYRRQDGSTPKFLKRALDSVMSQTYSRWKVFLIGDRYDRPQEIHDLLQHYDSQQIIWKNLAIADERDTCDDADILWRNGGVNAYNTAIDQALMEGYQYIAHLDHDDIWQPNHISEIASAISITGASWVCTRAQHFDGQILPRLINQTDYIVPFTPVYSSVIHSSVCMNFCTLPLRYRNLWKLNNDRSMASDADMWERCRRYILDHNLRSIAINRVTCLHQQEQG